MVNYIYFDKDHFNISRQNNDMTYFNLRLNFSKVLQQKEALFKVRIFENCQIESAKNNENMYLCMSLFFR